MTFFVDTTRHDAVDHKTENDKNSFFNGHYVTCRPDIAWHLKLSFCEFDANEGCDGAIAGKMWKCGAKKCACVRVCERLLSGKRMAAVDKKWKKKRSGGYREREKERKRKKEREGERKRIEAKMYLKRFHIVQRLDCYVKFNFQIECNRQWSAAIVICRNAFLCPFDACSLESFLSIRVCRRECARCFDHRLLSLSPMHTEAQTHSSRSNSSPIYMCEMWMCGQWAVGTSISLNIFYLVVEPLWPDTQPDRPNITNCGISILVLLTILTIGCVRANSGQMAYKRSRPLYVSQTARLWSPTTKQIKCKCGNKRMNKICIRVNWSQIFRNYFSTKKKWSFFSFSRCIHIFLSLIDNSCPFIYIFFYLRTYCLFCSFHGWGNKNIVNDIWTTRFFVDVCVLRSYPFSMCQLFMNALIRIQSSYSFIQRLNDTARLKPIFMCVYVCVWRTRNFTDLHIASARGSSARS